MQTAERHFKLLLFAGCLSPAVVLGGQWWQGLLGANPVEAITRESGIWALRFLLITLAVTPLRRISGWHGVVRYRRMLGLFAFFYASLHLLIYLWLEQSFFWGEILLDIQERPFITVGFVTFLILLLLTITSPKAAVRWMGGRRWRRLHRLVYLAAAGGVIHYWWLVKVDVRNPTFYALFLGGLLLLRLFFLKGRAWFAVKGKASCHQPAKASTGRRLLFDGFHAQETERIELDNGGKG